MNSSNRFSAVAEVALPCEGHWLSAHGEARFTCHHAEQSFVLPTRPAVVLPNTIISPAQSARRSGVASDAR